MSTPRRGPARWSAASSRCWGRSAPRTRHCSSPSWSPTPSSTAAARSSCTSRRASDRREPLHDLRRRRGRDARAARGRRARGGRLRAAPRRPDRGRLGRQARQHARLVRPRLVEEALAAAHVRGRVAQPPGQRRAASSSSASTVSAASSRLPARCSSGKSRASSTPASQPTWCSRSTWPSTSPIAQLSRCCVSWTSHCAREVAVALEVLGVALEVARRRPPRRAGAASIVAAGEARPVGRRPAAGRRGPAAAHSATTS